MELIRESDCGGHWEIDVYIQGVRRFGLSRAHRIDALRALISEIDDEMLEMDERKNDLKKKLEWCEKQSRPSSQRQVLTRGLSPL